MAKNGNRDYYPQQNNETINQIPDELPPQGIVAEGGYDVYEATRMAQDITQAVKNASAAQENAYDAKKMERMVKGMSYDQQAAMARQFNHYALLDGLRYQLEHLDELESDINNAFAKLAESREEK